MCHLSLRESAAKTSPSGGGAAAGGRRGAFPSPAGRLACFPFARQGGCMVLFILAAQPPTITLSGEAAVKPENPRGESPVNL